MSDLLASVSPQYHAHVQAQLDLYKLQHPSEVATGIVCAPNEHNGEDITITFASGASTQLSIAEDEPEALSMADPEYRTHVLAAVLHHSDMTGQHWHLTAVQKCQALSSGDVDIGLVLCSGAACMMLNFKVAADMTVEQSHSRF